MATLAPVQPRLLTPDQREDLRAGKYSDEYFNTTRTIMLEKCPTPVTMQIFQRRNGVIAGVRECKEILAHCAGHTSSSGQWISGREGLDVRSLDDGDHAGPFEPVMSIRGDYGLFAHLETALLGVLSRGTLIARNTAAVVAAADGIPVFFFAARFNRFESQVADGYAADIGGAAGVSTPNQGRLIRRPPIGTVPHALIAAHGGDTVAAAWAFSERYPERNLTPLVDFDNDCVGTAIRVADALGERLWGVRLDTSGSMVDRFLWEQMGTYAPTGVCPELVHAVRQGLDRAGRPDVRIVVSGGFGQEKVRRFVAESVPVDAFGVGSSLLTGSNDYTADIVEVNGQPCAKVGRHARDEARLTGGARETNHTPPDWSAALDTYVATTDHNGERA